MSYTQGFATIAKAAGLGGVRLHDCRHGFASGMLEAGVAVEVVSALLGHASVSTTYNVYVHVRQSQMEQGVAALEAVFGA